MPEKRPAHTQHRILITGGNGHLGKLLTEVLLNHGYEVNHLNRKAGTDERVKTYIWDVRKGRIDRECIDGAEMVVHLAGANIADKKWTESRKKELIDSRTKSIRLLYELIKSRPNRITTIISASAIGYYGDRGEDMLDEEREPGQGFLAECCVAWEKAVDEGKSLGLRIVKFRTGVVLDKNDGALLQMAKPIKFLVGSPLGKGRQWVPWIHWQDVVNMYLYAIEHIHLTGTYNMVAPEPVTNEQLTQDIARQLRKPLWLPNVPAFALKLLLGEMSTMVLNSTKVSAQKINDEGFEFEYPQLTEALTQIYG
jgi:uncharacterized protein